MSTSTARISANQINAKKSTGPITSIGKRKVATNATKHGLFSKNLILADEDPIEYENLLVQLQSELAPSGIIEQAFVERIAVSLWRQKRLVRAETAYIELDCKLKHVVTDVNRELNLTYSDKLLSEADLMEFDADHYQWCQGVLKEYETIASGNLPNIAKIEQSMPLIYQQLLSGAQISQQSPEEYLQQFDQPIMIFADLARYCRQQIKQAEQRPLILEITRLVKDKRSIPKDKLREALSGYQVMLDNELYKAIKALRDAQEWRFKTLTVVSENNGFVIGDSLQ